MNVADLHALMARDAPPVLVDVRSPGEYAARHIVGARSGPLMEITRRVAELPRFSLVVLY
jgi:rhodanese-related sulfurtransferase